MQQIPDIFMRNPGGENEGGGEDQKDESKAEGLPEEKSKEKGFFGKIKDALQDWSNTDEQEQEEDNSSPIT